MFKRLSVIMLLVTFNSFLTGCMALSEKFYAYKQNVEQQKLANKDEQEKNERKKIVENFLKYGPELSPDPYIQSLAGDYRGSTCNGKANITLNISYIYSFPIGDRAPTALIVHGKMRLSGPDGRSFETFIIGKVQNGEKYKGPLTIESIKQPTFRQFIELVTNRRDRFNQLILDDTAKDSSLLDAFERRFGSRMLEEDASIVSPSISMQMILASDADKTGWVGSFVAKGFEDCTEFAMKNTAGKSTASFMPVTANTAYGISAFIRDVAMTSGQDDEKNLRHKLYWYKIIEKLGFDKEAQKNGYDHVFIANALAETHMKLAQVDSKSSVQHYQLAREYYLKNAIAIGDARAQHTLAQIYRQGLGTPVNNKEAEKWQALFSKTYAAAARICTQPKTVNTMYTLLDHELLRARKLGLLFYIFTSIDIDPGETKLLMISAANVVTLDRPYQCVTLGKRVGAKIDVSDLPDYVEVGQDNLGRVYYYDKSFEKSVLTTGANVIERIMQELPVRPVFAITPIGDRKFKLNLKDSFEKDIEIDL